MEILAVVILYILDCVMFVNENKDLFLNYNIKHHYKTTYKSNFTPEKRDFTKEMSNLA